MFAWTRKVFIIGGAGFIGSHIVDRLLADADTEQVTVYDNFSSGKDWHLVHHRNDDRLHIIRGEVENIECLMQAMNGHALVIHLASNPDIARAITEPAIDFNQGTLLTHCVVEAMRMNQSKMLLYASGSGVYGDIGHVEAPEDYAPLLPISTYAASKLAGEAMICAYCHMFNIKARVFRFGNVVGARQTHGVGYDFIRRLRHTPGHLKILGNGTQTKSYIHVSDVMAAMFMALERETAHYQVYNVATRDYVSVNEIAQMAIEAIGLEHSKVRLEHTGGDRGWKGDVPIVQLNSQRIRALGWHNHFSCTEALKLSLQDMIEEFVWQR